MKEPILHDGYNYMKINFPNRLIWVSVGEVGFIRQRSRLHQPTKPTSSTNEADFIG